MGLWKPRPQYTDKAYYNLNYEPTLGESKLFHALLVRSTLTTREAVHQMADSKEARLLKNEKSMEKFLKVITILFYNNFYLNNNVCLH